MYLGNSLITSSLRDLRGPWEIGREEGGWVDVERQGLGLFLAIALLLVHRRDRLEVGTGRRGAF